MARLKCAASTFGLAVALGALVGAVFTFVSMIVEQQSLPSTQAHPLQWGVFSYAAAIALIGGIAGVLIGIAAWSVAAAAFLIVDRLASRTWVRAVAVAIGGGLGAAAVLFAIASQPGMSTNAPYFTGAIAMAMALAVGTMFATQRVFGSRASNH